MGGRNESVRNPRTDGCAGIHAMRGLLLILLFSAAGCTTVEVQTRDVLIYIKCEVQRDD